MNIFECNICLERAKDAVLSRCGHLFCWPCLDQWFLMRPFNKRCPVCRTPIDRDNVIPLFGENNIIDPRNKFLLRVSRFSSIWKSIQFRYFISFWLIPLCFLITSSRKFEDLRTAGTHGGGMLCKEQILWKLFLFTLFLCLRRLLLADRDDNEL